MEAVKNYMSFVEIKTKLATVIPFATGAAYAYYASGDTPQTRYLNLFAIFLFWLTMFPFDMAVTAINNHIGKRASGVKPHYSRGVSLAVITCLILMSTVAGLFMTYKYGVVVLLVGIICFGVGIFYTFGPVPIANSAYGEIFSGGVQGFLVPFLAAYISLPHHYLNLSISWISSRVNGGFEKLSLFDSIPTPVLEMGVDVSAFIQLFIVTIPLVCCIANIMLANNICDMEEDVRVNRFTLPYYLGVPKALRLFTALYLLAECSIVFAVVTRTLPVTCLLALLSHVVIRKNIAAFKEKQVKSETFPLAVNNFTLLCTAYIITILAGSLF